METKTISRLEKMIKELSKEVQIFKEQNKLLTLNDEPKEYDETLVRVGRPKNTRKDRLPILKEDFERIIYLTKRDKSMKSVTKKKLLRAYTILYCTGARISEITNFNKEDIDFLLKNEYVILEDTKTNTMQRLEARGEALKIIESLNFNDCEDYLFYKNNSNCSMTVGGLDKLVNTHLKKQLNQLYTSHSFRAGFITRVVEATGNIRTASALARHKNINTTLMYIGTSDKQIDEAFEKKF